MKTTVYSATPLAKKLGLKDNFKIKLVHSPEYYFSLFTDLPAGLETVEDPKQKKDFIHYFATDAKQLEQDIPGLRSEIRENGMIWISWPKKAAKMKTDVTEHVA